MRVSPSEAYGTAHSLLQSKMKNVDQYKQVFILSKPDSRSKNIVYAYGLNDKADNEIATVIINATTGKVVASRVNE